jgi:hypothetical protein
MFQLNLINEDKYMKTHHLKKIIFFLTLLGASHASWAACDKTLSPGADVASAVSSAPNGSTICLNSGNYGTVNLTNITRSGYVTIQSTTDKGASISPQLWNTDYVRLQSLAISSSASQQGCSVHVQWVNNKIDGAGLTLKNPNCGNIDTLVEGNSFRNYNFPAGWYNGRLNVVYGSGVTVRNNYFGDGGNADGIQVLGQASDVNITGNTFSGILQSLCGDMHCDSIQLYGAGPRVVINGNHFYNDSVFIMAPDGSDDVTVTNNVFDGSSVNYAGKVQFGSANNPRFEHNVVLNTNVGFSSKSGQPASTNVVAKNNILKGGRFDTSVGNGCSNCSFTRNLFYTSDIASGTNNLVGIPTYVGGAAPTKYTGFQLTSSSLGYKVATDGSDMGVVFTGTTTSPTTVLLSAPTNLRVN